jgi:hypothetical protein
MDLATLATLKRGRGRPRQSFAALVRDVKKRMRRDVTWLYGDVLPKIWVAVVHSRRPISRELYREIGRPLGMTGSLVERLYMIERARRGISSSRHIRSRAALRHLRDHGGLTEGLRKLGRDA